MASPCCLDHVISNAGEAAAKQIGPDAIPLQLDATDRVSIAAAAERIRKEFDRLDLLGQRHLHATPSSMDAVVLKKGRSSEGE